MKKLIAISLVFVLTFGLWGCGDDNEGGNFQYDIPTAVTSLDPQFVTDDYAKSVLGNCMEGLLRQQADGSVIYALAESSQVSADQTIYTFTLRQGLTWEDGTPLTAHDFEFGLRRHFSLGVISPYASDFLIIKNAEAILSGELPAADLGVKAVNDTTLVIELEAPNAFLGQLLSSTAALPCNQAFFESTRGRYGTGDKTLLCNGPFRLSSWTDEKLVLRKNDSYYNAQAVLPQSVTLQIGRQNPTQLLLEGKSHAGPLGYEQLEQAVKAGLSYETFDNTTWALCFNQKDTPFGDRQMRVALQMAIDRQQLEGELHDALKLTSQFVPPSSLIFDKTYRERAGEAVTPPYNPETAKELFRQALAAQGLDKLSGINILVPERANQFFYASFIQQMWQRNLSLYVNIQQLPEQEFNSRVAAGNYDIAILPFTSNRPDPLGLLGKFMTDASDNVAGYADEEFDRIVTQATEAATVDETVRLFLKAEDLLLSEAVVVPLYFETTYFAMAKGVLGVEYSPYSGKLLFQNASKK